jgi:phenylacetaldehyde dehydrogenase
MSSTQVEVPEISREQDSLAENALIHNPEKQLSSEARAFLARPKKLYVGGQFIDAADGEMFETEDPALGTGITRVPSAGRLDVDRASGAAREAFEKRWRNIAPAQRSASLLKLADLITQNSEELAQLVAGIVPWNYPFVLASWKIAPALAAGCTMILKPAEETPLTALRLAELCEEAGLPHGVLNVLTGFGETTGAALVQSNDIDKVTFTGSLEVGKKIVQAAAGNLKRVTLELGGKSPSVIFADAHLDSAIPVAAFSVFHNTGQVCCAGSRLYVEKKVFDRVVEGIGGRAKQLRLGAAFNPESEIGPLMSAIQLNRVESFVNEGAQAGAEIFVGGKHVGDRGYFYEPTILLNTSPAMRVQREEIFGPVLCAMSFESAEEIPAVANQTRYGLAATIWTRDTSKALRLARTLNAGAVWINCAEAFDPHLPWGGVKESGWGRELGQEGIEAFTELKAITVKL